ncbi:Parg [Symbiodinium sp. CCMP2592]|nr:Parg [Symbiodinium sp. CCMP2592]
MAFNTESLTKFVEDCSARDAGAAEVTAAVSRVILSNARSADQLGSLVGLESALEDVFTDLPRAAASVIDGLVNAAKVLLAASQNADSPVHGKPEAFSRQQLQPPAGETAIVRLAVSRLQCLEILAAGFFGFLQRDWYSRQPVAADLPGFGFEKLWLYDCRKWHGKNFVLMAVLLYFAQMSQQSKDLMDEALVFKRKAFGAHRVGDEVFCAVEMQQDGVSIHGFDGPNHLQADFANQYLGGGVLSGGGTQEECMFVEFPELLASIYLVERMLPHEAVEMVGARKFVEHNMGAGRHTKRDEQFCRPAATIGPPIVAVALDAISYRRKPGYFQYAGEQILREVQKCCAALAPDAGTGRRKFVTGLWGCGAFGGDSELKFVIQWMSCSLTPSVESMVFCPFDQQRHLTGAGLPELLATLAGKVKVKTVLECLVDDADYSSSRNTFRYLLEKLKQRNGSP